jgi:hypothetical protein
LEQCLKIHEKIVPVALKPLHNSLVEGISDIYTAFEKNYENELAGIRKFEEKKRFSGTQQRLSISASLNSTGSKRGSLIVSVFQDPANMDNPTNKNWSLNVLPAQLQ